MAANKAVTINVFKFRRYIKLFDPTKCSIEALSHNEAKWTKTIDDLYTEILNAAAEVVTNFGVDQADTTLVESMLDAIENEYREYFVKLRAKLYHDYKGAMVIAKKDVDVDTSAQSIQCEPHSHDSKATAANIAHTVYERAGIESIQRDLQMVGNNGQVDVAIMELYPSAMEDNAAVQIASDLSFSVQMEAGNPVQFTTECRDFVTRYTRVYNAATAKLHSYSYRLYECEEVRGQLSEVEEVLYSNATISSRDKDNFIKRDFRYHRNEG